jgi:hypothetical protein
MATPAGPMPSVTAPAPVAPAVAYPAPVAQPQPVAAPFPVEELPEEEHPKKHARGNRARIAAEPTEGGIPKVVVYLLGGYALVMTLLAVYGLFIKTDKIDPGHPLSTIPDNFGEFPATERKKVSQFKNLDVDVPANQRAQLGSTITVGQLEITPIDVAQRKLQIVREPTKGGAPTTLSSNYAALVLQLRVKNTSPDTQIYPLDPAFTRRATRDDKPLTRLVMGSKAIPGGAITWPFDEKKGLKREYEEKQKDDGEPLKPGETRDYVVFTEANEATLTRTVKASKEPLQWRVQVRRGLIDFRGKAVPVTAVIGVDFKATDIKTAAE